MCFVLLVALFLPGDLTLHVKDCCTLPGGSSEGNMCSWSDLSPHIHTSLHLGGVWLNPGSGLGRIQVGFEYLHRRRLHEPSGQPVPGLRQPQRKEVLPHVQTELPLLQFVPIASCPVTGHHWKESGQVALAECPRLLPRCAKRLGDGPAGIGPSPKRWGLSSAPMSPLCHQFQAMVTAPGTVSTGQRWDGKTRRGGSTGITIWFKQLFICSKRYYFTSMCPVSFPSILSWPYQVAELNG